MGEPCPRLRLGSRRIKSEKDQAEREGGSLQVDPILGTEPVNLGDGWEVDLIFKPTASLGLRISFQGHGSSSFITVNIPALTLSLLPPPPPSRQFLFLPLPKNGLKLTY